MRAGLFKKGVPRSGQTAVFRAGDAGTYQPGLPKDGDRFLVVGDGTVKDLATGLTWVRAPHLMIPGEPIYTATNEGVPSGNWANSTLMAVGVLKTDNVASPVTVWACIEEHTSAAAPTTFAQDRAGAAAGKWVQNPFAGYAYEGGTRALMTWDDAIDECEALEFAGFDDWRLPGWDEMATLVKLEPPFHAVFPIESGGGWFWTGDTFEWEDTKAHSLDFDRTTCVHQPRTKSGKSCNAWPVRGGLING